MWPLCSGSIHLERFHDGLQGGGSVAMLEYTRVQISVLTSAVSTARRASVRSGKSCLNLERDGFRQDLGAILA